MKQPDLGKKIAELRQQKNLTQDDLVEKCNINVRTIQRIEAGEVNPRPSTLRIIIEALGEDFNELFKIDSNTSFISSALVLDDIDKTQKVKNILQTAWIAGIIYFVIGLIEGGMEYMMLEDDLTTYEKPFYILIKIAVIGSFFLFYRGLVAVGKLYDNYLLRIGAYLAIAAYFIVIVIDIFNAVIPMQEEVYIFIQAGASITVGAIGVIYAVGLIRLNRSVGTVAFMAGVLELIIAFCFITVVLFIVGFVLLVPAVLLEVLVLYKVQEGLSKREQSEEL